MRLIFLALFAATIAMAFTACATVLAPQKLKVASSTSIAKSGL
jgi:hypothetical protein